MVALVVAAPSVDGVGDKARLMCKLDKKHDTMNPYSLYGVNRFLAWAAN
jgi:hypothetical protein